MELSSFLSITHWTENQHLKKRTKRSAQNSLLWARAIPTRSPHLRLLQPIIRNSERKRRLGVNLAPIKFHIFYQVRFWYPLETNV